MLVRSVELNNIRSYVDTKVDFPEGSVMLSGDIGSGKSTVLLAIEFALFGLLRGEVDGTALLRHGKSNGHVTVHFSIDGKDVVVHRTLKRGKNGIAQAAGYLIVDDVKTEGTAVELKGRILDMLGYPKSLLTKSKSLIYRYTIYTPQEEMKHILFEDAPARLDTLRKVFQIDKYKLVRENSVLAVRSLKEQRKLFEALTNDLPQKQEDEQRLDAKEKELSQVLSILQQSLEKASKRVSAQTGRISLLEHQREQAHEIKRKLSITETAIQEKNSSLASYQKQMSSLELELRDVRARWGDDETPLLRQKTSVLKGAIQVLEQELGRKDGVSEAMQGLESELRILHGAIASQEALKKDAENKIASVEKLQNCPVCLQAVTQEHKARILSVEQEKQATFAKNIAKQQANKNVAEKRMTLLKSSLEQLQGNEMLVIEGNALLEHVNTLTQTQPAPVQSVPNVKEYIASVKEIYNKAQDLRSSKVLLKEKETALSTFQGAASKLAQEITALQQEGTELEEKLKGFSVAENEYDSAKKDLEALQRGEKELAVKNSSLEAEIKGVRENIVVLEKDIKEKIVAKKKLAATTQLQGWLEESFYNMVAVIEKQVMLRIYNDFNAFFQQWFNVLLEDEAITARLDDTFTPVVVQDGYEVFAQNLSGGEKTSCALAYRLALNKVINDLITTIKTKSLLILDEPTDGFSTEQLDKVRDVIEQLNVEQLILVSHETKIESFVQNVIRITKQNNLSRVQE